MLPGAFSITLPPRMHRRPRHSNSAKPRINFSAGGERIWKRLTIRVIGPPPEDNDKQQDFKWYPRAPAGRGYSEDDVQGVLEQCAMHLEKRFPVWEFRLVELGPDRFNFIFDRVKDVGEVSKMLERPALQAAEP